MAERLPSTCRIRRFRNIPGWWERDSDAAARNEEP